MLQFYFLFSRFYFLVAGFGFPIFSAMIFSARIVALRRAERFFAKADFGRLRYCFCRTLSNIPLWRTTLVNRCTKFCELSFSFFFTSKAMLVTNNHEYLTNFHESRIRDSHLFVRQFVEIRFTFLIAPSFLLRPCLI